MKLESGLELVHFPILHTRFVDIALAVGVGTRFEPARLMGISHFTEHIVFRGCVQLPSSYELNLAFDRIGEGLNALTHKEFTLYTTRVPSDDLARVLRLMAGVVSEPLFRDIETERGIILEEILEELDERGKDNDIENISRRLVFGDHPLSYPVLGRPQTVKAISQDNLVAHHAMYYRPSNMVLSIAGGAAWSKCREAAEASFGRKFVRTARLQDTSVKPNLAEPAPRLEEVKAGVHFINDSGSQVEVLMSFFMPGEQFPGELARVFLSRVLDDGISSRLQRTICERRGLLYDISTGIESFTDVALFDIQFSVSAKKLVDVVEVIVGELRLLKSELVGSQEFETVRGRLRRDIYSTAESSRAMAGLLAEAFILKLPMPVDPKEYEGRINELTPESAREEALRAFRFDRCAFVAKGMVTPKQRRDLLRALKGL